MEFCLILGNTKAGIFNRGKEYLTKGGKEYRPQVVKHTFFIECWKIL